MSRMSLARVRIVALACAAACLARSHEARPAGIVPDGGTATIRTTATTGRQTVRIAPAIGGVSHNTYTQFDVDRNGADFINTGVNARLILNEVTGSSPSQLQGRIAILGSRAHFILANPNGITIDGGSFLNTGNVALSTGHISFNTFDPGDGSLQRNVLLTTDAGRIDITGQGLSGTFNSLELIAKTIRIGAPVSNLAGNGRTRLVAGSSRAEFNSAVDGFDGLTPWVQYQSANGAAPGAIAVDITSLGSLNAGRIEILVADSGAGVRHAGVGLASAGDFTVTTAGNIELTAGQIAAAGDVALEGQVASMHAGSNGALSQIAADGDVDLRFAQADLRSGSIAAGRSGGTGNITIGIPAATAGGPLRLGHEVIGGSLRRLTLDAGGGIALESAGQSLVLDAAQAFAAQNVLVNAGQLQMNVAWQGDTPFAAQIQSRAGQVQVNASGAIQSIGSNILGAQGIVARAGAIGLAASVRGSRIEESAWTASAADIDVAATGDLRVTGSDLLAQTHVRLAAADISLDADPITSRRSTVVAATGALMAQASGSIRNRASLMQGETRLTSDPQSRGAMTLIAGGDILNESANAQRLAAMFGRADDVVLQAGGNIVNRSGRVLSNGALSLSAGADIENIIDKTPGANGEARVSFSRREPAFLFFSRRVSGFDQDFGSLLVPERLAYLIGSGNVTLQSRNVVSRGGEIDANAGDIDIRATGRIDNEALRTGRVHFESRCLIVCRKTAESTATLSGGTLNAAGRIHLTAGTAVNNVGGRVLSLGDMLIDAPIVTARALPVYNAVGLKVGLNAGVGGTWGRIYAADQGGAFTANRGRLVVNGAVVIDGGNLAASDGVAVRDGITTRRRASREAVTADNHLGLFDWLF